MRIIAGKYKGRVINIPKGIRPTQDKVRKALFDILSDIKGLSFLELFAGSGAMGLEAGSRGAGKIVFVEESPDCIKALKKNFSWLVDTEHSLIPFDVFKAIVKLAKEKARFDMVFLDPPYYKDLAKKTLKILSSYDIVAPSGFIVIQHFKKDDLPVSLGDLILLREARYGDTVLSFYKKS